jgi:tetraacyldisaccharide 4'-kinase
MDYRSLMSGARKDPLAGCLRGGLQAASWLYAAAVRLRNRRYDRHVAEIHRCGVPVISVGNLTTGGTGKTPIVCYLARWFRQRGIRVAIVSRGYGRGDADANDEALELHSRLGDVPHVQDPDRVEAARIAVEELQTELILMDDGFQHRRLHRDLNLVVIDATCPFGYGYLLPRGLLREPLTGLQRADLAIVSRCGSVDDQTLRAIESTIRQYNAAIPIVHSNHQPHSLLEYPSDQTPIAGLAGENVAVLSAIGNPAAFLETVKQSGANVIAEKALGDHDPYAPETVKQLDRWIRGLGDQLSRVVCTHKDLVKLRADRLGGVPLSAILIELTILQGSEILDAVLEDVAAEIGRLA